MEFYSYFSHEKWGISFYSCWRWFALESVAGQLWAVTRKVTLILALWMRIMREGTCSIDKKWNQMQSILFRTLQNIPHLLQNNNIIIIIFVCYCLFLPKLVRIKICFIVLSGFVPMRMPVQLTPWNCTAHAQMDPQHRRARNTAIALFIVIGLTQRRQRCPVSWARTVEAAGSWDWLRKCSG